MSILLRPGCQVAAGWLEGLRDAAHASSTTATATALTQHDLDPAPEPFERAAAAVARRLASAASPDRDARRRLRLRAPHRDRARRCRDAGLLLGCVERGLAHVLADDVLVLDPRPAEARTDQPTPAETRATGAARRALHGLSVTIDARILSGPDDRHPRPRARADRRPGPHRAGAPDRDRPRPAERGRAGPPADPPARESDHVPGSVRPAPTSSTARFSSATPATSASSSRSASG